MNSTIFTTKNNKLAIFGKTIDDVRKKLIDFNDIIMQGGSFGKNANAKQLIPIEKLFKELSNNEAKKIVDTLNSIKDGTNATFTSMDGYLSYLDREGKGYIKNYVKENQNQVYVTDDVIDASRQARLEQIAYNETIRQSTLAFKAASIAKRIFATIGNMAAMWALSKAISAVTDTIGELVHSEENLRQSASDLGSELSNNSSDIEGYKKKIDELKAVINDSSSSFDKVSQARLDLMTIQDELIEKFGTEKGVIESITSAINDQTDALDELSKRSYFKAKNKFNEKTGGDKFVDWLTFGNTDDDRIKSNMDKMVSSMQYSFYELKTTGNEVLDNLIAKSYGLNIVEDMYGNGKHFQIYGTLDEIQDKLYGIQELSQDFDLSTGFENSFTTISNDVDNALTKYKNLYDQYVLYEKILTNNPDNQYDEQFDLINKAKEAYSKAVKSGSEEDIKASADEYAKTLQSAIDLAMGNYDYDVADYFKAMYPELQQMFGEWQFSLNFEPNTDGLQDKVADALDSIDGVSDGTTSFSVEDIENFNPNVATQEQIDAYGELINVAETYGLTVKQLISLLETMGLIQSESYQQLVDTFGQNNVNKLSPEDIKIAYTIENAGNMTFEQLQSEIKNTKEITYEPPISFSDIFSLKDADDNLTTLGKISESIDTIQNAYQTLSDAIDEYNEEGAFSIDTLQSVIALGDDWLDYLVDEEGALKLDKESLEQLTLSRLNDMRIQAINNVINNVSKIENDASANDYLKSTNYALAESYEGLAKAKLEDARASMEAAVAAGTLSQANMDAAMSKAKSDIEKINNLFNNTSFGEISIKGGSGSSKSPKSSSSSSSEFKETVDFFEHRVGVLNDALELLKTNLENVVGSNAKNLLIDAQIGINKESINNYTDALAMYQSKATEALAKIPEDLQPKITEGAVSLVDFVGSGNEELVDAIKDYQKWSDKVSDCRQELAKLKETIRQLELDKFNNIIKDFTDRLDISTNAQDFIKKQIDLFQEAGQVIGKGFYEGLIKESEGQLSILEAEKQALMNELNTGLNTGLIEAGTDEWLEMVNAFLNVDGSILDCKKDIEEFNNSIQKLHWDTLERIEDNFGDLANEISNLIGLIDEADVANKDGIWSPEGLTQLGLYAQEYERAVYTAKLYADEIEKLNQAYMEGNYSATEYADKLSELKKAQWNEINASKDAKDAIADLNKARVDIMVKGIEDEIDAMKELTDSKIKALDAEKDLNDYRNSLAQKNKSITDLERQIAAMQNDTTAASIAKRKNLEEQLAEAKRELADFEYEHSIEVQKETLNQQYEDFEAEKNNEIAALQNTLNEQETLIAASFETIKQNAAVIGNELSLIASNYGITISESLTTAWQSGSNAIASYGTALTEEESRFILNLGNMVMSTYSLQEQADITAVSLANMYNTNSSKLQSDLVNSYYCIANVNTATQVLQSSLVSTLDRGYDVSSLVNQIDSIGDSAANAADSVNALTDALERRNAAHKGNLGESYTGTRVEQGINGYTAPTLDPSWLPSNTKLKLRKYAKGGIVTKDDNNPLNAIAKSVGEDTLIAAKDGESILTPVQTTEFMKLAANMEAFNSVMPKPFNNTALKNISAVQKAQPSVQIHYDNLVQVQGDVNNSNIRQMESIVNNAVTKQFNQFNCELYKRGVR